MFLIEPRWIEVTRYDMYLPGLPDELDGIRIEQISDLHRSKRVPDSIIEKAVRITNEQSPDIVAVTGDFINTSSANAEPCAKMLSKLDTRMGVYAVLGNHDHWYSAKDVTHALESNGVRVLTNKNREIAKGLFIIGVDDMWSGRPDIKRAWSGIRESSAQVLLSHTPTAIELVKNKRCMILSGHTHGGQITIPFIKRNELPGLKGHKRMVSRRQCQHVCKPWNRYGDAPCAISLQA
jgi:predicted MPP superfamily phosphohydrolase